MRVRILALVASVVLTLGLVVATIAVAQEPGVDAEAAREAAAAAALEANPGPELRSAAVFTPPAVISAPLFIGLSDAATDTYLVDPATGDSFPLFDGFEIWGAAFDPEGRQVFFNRGPTLYVWPLDSAPTSLGLMRGGESGANLSMAGLAYAGGELYASRAIGSAADPEGVYVIDTTTLSATLVLSYTDAGRYDVGGLDADPALPGAFYGTNDDADARGLVRLLPDGQIEAVAPYPEGEDDIDGLAVGDGRAYLVTDEPGPIFVFDFATMTYTVPISSPWTASELFAGAAWIQAEAPLTPTIALTKTVGLGPTACDGANNLEVPAGTEVTYCYRVTNTGAITLTRHTLEDSALGALLTDAEQELAPGQSTTLTETAVITAAVTNTATWTAFNPGPTDVATATATATVTLLPQPAITLTKTVGVDPADCAASSAISVNRGAAVVYCYTVTNTGDVSLALHDLTDSALGDLLDGHGFDLAPGATTSITRTATLTATTVNTATWTAYNEGPADVVSATATATVTILEPEIVVTPTALTVQAGPYESVIRTLTISNTGTANLEWTVTFAAASCDEPGARPWVSAAPTAGTAMPGNESTVTVTFDPRGLASGARTGVLCVNSNDADEPTVAVPLSLTIGQYAVHLPIIAGSPED